MSHNSSLGSSPIGLASSNGSMAFIRDLGVKEKAEKRSVRPLLPHRENDPEEHCSEDTVLTSFPTEEVKKEIVSYNLDKRLVTKIKSAAEDQHTYYSTLVGRALKFWLDANGY